MSTIKKKAFSRERKMRNSKVKILLRKGKTILSMSISIVLTMVYFSLGAKIGN